MGPFRVATTSKFNRSATDSFVHALTHGLGERKMNLWWKVRPIQRNGDIVDGGIRYSFFGNERLVCGFKGYDRVFSRITEEENRIVARFYRGPADAKADKDVIKESQRFVMIKFDATRPTPEIQKTLRKYQVTGFPSLVFVDTKGDIHPLIGYVKPDKLVDFMKNIR